MSYHAPKIKNETNLDGRIVAGCVRFVFRYLDLDGSKTMVKVKHHSKNYYAYAGRCYIHAHRHKTRIYDRDGYNYSDVGPVIPSNLSHLIVCRIAKPEVFPRENHVYDRKDSPGSWEITDWRAALVAITAHEAMHLRQYLIGSNNRGRLGEVDTEWAAKRIHDEWMNR